MGWNLGILNPESGVRKALEEIEPDYNRMLQEDMEEDLELSPEEDMEPDYDDYDER